VPRDATPMSDLERELQAINREIEAGDRETAAIASLLKHNLDERADLGVRLDVLDAATRSLRADAGPGPLTPAESARVGQLGHALAAVERRHEALSLPTDLRHRIQHLDRRRARVDRRLAALQSRVRELE